MDRDGQRRFIYMTRAGPMLWCSAEKGSLGVATVVRGLLVWSERVGVLAGEHDPNVDGSDSS